MHSRLLTGMATALVAAAIVGVPAGTASATRLEIPASEAGFAIIWTGLEFKIGGSATRCATAGRGIFHNRNFTKTAEILIGNIREIIIELATCTGGEIRAEVLPWNVRYESFTGTLPNITSIKLRVINARFTIRSTGLGVTCTMLSSATEPLVLIGGVTVEGGGSRIISTMRADETAGITARGGGGVCELVGVGKVNVFGTGTVLHEEETGNVRLRLI